MSRPEQNDPRKLGGGIVGGDDPYEEGGAVIDTRSAVLLENTQVAQIDNPSDGRTFVALELEGRINQSSDRARVLYLLNGDGAAALCSELIGLAGRSREPWAREFVELFKKRMEELP